jgi:hypothetical protein
VPVDPLAPGETRVWTLRVPQEDDAPARLDRVEAIGRAYRGTVTPLGSGVLASGGEDPPALAVRVRAREGAEGRVDLDLRVGSAEAPAAGVSLALRFPDLDGPLRDLAEVRVAETPVLVAGAPGAEADAVLGLRWRGDGARPALPLALRLRAGDHAWTLPFTLPGTDASREADLALVPPVLMLGCGPDAVPCVPRTVAQQLPLVVRVDDDGPLASLALDAGAERVHWRNGRRVVEVEWRRVAWEDLSVSDDGRQGAATRRWSVPLGAGAHRLRVVAEDAQGLRQVRTLVVVREEADAGAGGVTGGGQPPVP